MTNRDQLILDHMLQVRLIAAGIHRRCPHFVELDDLMSAGTIGLIQAIDRYDPDRGFKIKTLAEHRIRGAMLDYLRKIDPLPRAVRHFARQRQAVIVRFKETLGRSPDDSELAHELNLPIERCRRLTWTVRASQTVSLETVRDR